MEVVLRSIVVVYLGCFCVFFFNDTATTEIYTLSLHDALPIFAEESGEQRPMHLLVGGGPLGKDRKSTRLNSSHDQNSYAVFCLKKKNKLKLRRRRGDVQRAVRFAHVVQVFP